MKPTRLAQQCQLFLHDYISIQLKKSGVHIISIGVGGWTDEEELNGIASYPHEGNRINVKSYEDLMAQTDGVLNIMCNSEQSRDVHF